MVVTLISFLLWCCFVLYKKKNQMKYIDITRSSQMDIKKHDRNEHLLPRKLTTTRQ